MLMGVVVGFLLASCIGRVLCALQNVSIDDTNGDEMTGRQITYNPANKWSLGPSCQTCEAKVSPASEAFDQTWHDTSFIKGGPLISASAIFTGSAVYVVCILTGTSQDPNGNSDMVFFIDGVEDNRFQQGPNGNPDYQFNSVVYSNESLTMESHNITIVTGTLGEQSLVLLDRIIYSTEVSEGGISSGGNTSPGSGSEPVVEGDTTTVLTKTSQSTVTTVSTATETSEVTPSVAETTLPKTGEISGFTSSSPPQSSQTTSTSSKQPTQTSSQVTPETSSGASHITGVVHSRHTVAIVLGVLGSLAALVAATIFLCLRKRRHQSRLKVAPWFGRVSVASDEHHTGEISSLSVEAPGMSLRSIHDGTFATIPSFYAGSDHSDSDSKLPSYEADMDTRVETETYRQLPVLEKL
ncbi:hypothetical protein SCHPADRAFT_935981 [Schizopora paradoxa]|uniref:Uncharacterized protein n=1 Tax=Schizopora paradoxa TaxID=27342 RepID=A0A0H2SNS4_9AGAM|nr:hypothetical protein SCHPADRAFT_935981 [Schizopora paradoxa]